MQKILSFQEFQKVYESAIVNEEESVVDTETGEPTTDIDALKDIIKDLEGEKEEVKEGLYEAEVNTLRPVKLGESSERVKEIQKLLDLKTTGKYDEESKKAVEKFQSQYKLKVDGIVGNQTYGKMLEIKGGIKDKAELDKKLKEFARLAKEVKKAVDSILTDPRLYEVFESVTIVVVGGETRIVCVPRKDAKEKIAELEAKKLLSAGFSWLKAVAGAIGKAIIYTAVAPVVVTIEVAKAIINGATSILKFAAKGAASVLTSALHGIAQISKWVKAKGAAAYSSLKASGEALWKNFCTKCASLLKSSKEGIIAFAASADYWLGKAAESFKTACYVALGAAAKAAGLAWDNYKTLSNAAKKGLSDLAAKGKEAAEKLKSGISAGYESTKQNIVSTGNAVVAGMKSAGKSAVTAIGDGIKYAGNQMAEFGGWISSLAEALYLETGDPIFESYMN